MRNSQASTSKIPPHMVACLSAEGWTAEELSFVESNEDWLETCSVYDWSTGSKLSVRAAMRIHARLEAQKGERNREYDSKNKLQRKDSPSWFGEGINRDLFK